MLHVQNFINKVSVIHWCGSDIMKLSNQITNSTYTAFITFNNNKPYITIYDEKGQVIRHEALTRIAFISILNKFLFFKEYSPESELSQYDISGSIQIYGFHT